MSDSVRPHRWQPTRLPRPWDSPGKNTGVGCYFLLQCVKVKSESEVTQSCPTLCDPMGCSLPGSSVHGILQARVPEWVVIAFSDSGYYWIFKKASFKKVNVISFLKNKHLQMYTLCIEKVLWTSLVVQWLRIHLSIRGTQTQPLVWEDSTCHVATKPVHCNYWSLCTTWEAIVLKPAHRNYRVAPAGCN